MFASIRADTGRGRAALVVAVLLLAVTAVLGATWQRADSPSAPDPAAAAAAVAPSQPVGASPSPSPSVSPPTALSAKADASSPLPFDMPAASQLRRSPRKVFAHYFPPLPVSIDNAAPDKDYYARNYLSPQGEKGKHAAYGGHLRDRPLPRPVRTSENWRVLDMETEVRQARAGGLDGFTVDLLELGDTGGRLWVNTLALMEAAERVDAGFGIVLMPDLSGSLRHKDVRTVARWVAELGKKPSAYRLQDGRLVVAPFRAESWAPAKWQEFLSVMKSEHDTPVAFVPTFLNEREHAEAFTSISYGMGNWGSRTATWNDPGPTHRDSARGRAERVQAMGKIWMQPVSIQDARFREGIFDEALNTTNLRNSWEVARRTGAEWVQLTTWNDYTESTSFAPSQKNGWSWLDLNAYYVAWFKTGVAPEIRRDAIYLTHRVHAVSAQPSGGQTHLMRVRSDVPTRDAAEALTFLRRPGTVTVKAGTRTKTCRVPAGVGVCTVPLGLGVVSATVASGSTTSSVTSPHRVVARPKVQDLAYVASSSRRSPAGRRAR